MFNSHSTAQIWVMFFNFISGLILSVVTFVLISIKSTAQISLTLRYIFRIFPTYCLGDGILILALCVDGQRCPSINSSGFDATTTVGPLNWDIAGANMAFLAAHAVVYFAATVGIEYSLTFPSLLSWLYAVEDEEDEEEGAPLGDAGGETGGTGGTGTGAGAGVGVVGVVGVVEGAEAGEDEDVLAERRRVLSGAADLEVVRIRQLRKSYPANSRAGGASLGACFGALWRGLRRAAWPGRARMHTHGSEEGPARVKAVKAVKVAVRRLTFGIPKGECFGFLGINGAGKTTTLSILCGEFPPSSGEAYIDGFSIARDQTNIRKRIG
jgi:ATP-binding cassette subfamily A (ABC1) protein 3